MWDSVETDRSSPHTEMMNAFFSILLESWSSPAIHPLTSRFSLNTRHTSLKRKPMGWNVLGKTEYLSWCWGWEQAQSPGETMQVHIGAGNLTHCSLTECSLTQESVANVVGFKVDVFSHMYVVISGCWFGNRCCSVTSRGQGLVSSDHQLPWGGGGGGLPGL